MCVKQPCLKCDVLSSCMCVVGVVFFFFSWEDGMKKVTGETSEIPRPKVGRHQNKQTNK